MEKGWINQTWNLTFKTFGSDYVRILRLDDRQHEVHIVHAMLHPTYVK